MKGIKSKRIFSNGFTMIELLMVMTILGALAGILLINYPSATKRARDTQRKSDLKQYQTALEIFANKNNGLYPARTTEWAQVATTLCSDLGYAASECPKDPKDDQNICGGGTNKCRYYYRSDGTDGSSDATKYVFYAALEKPVAEEYWVICSNGNIKEVDASSVPPSGGDCPS